jgi:Uma2 family endonuclease
MNLVGTQRATLDDLSRTQDKAELIGGRIVAIMPSGFFPALIGGRIYRSLDDHAQQRGVGVALPDGVGYAVTQLPSERESFSPDTSYYTGPLPADPMRFIDGAPTLAVEVRSENDYGAAAETDMAAKRADYFAAGTLVVWDVDPRAETVAVYRATAPTHPVTYRRGDSAEGEPAVPGWRMAVDAIFARLSGPAAAN